jgi:putative ABC transport system ATP-binding protein
VVVASLIKAGKTYQTPLGIFTALESTDFELETNKLTLIIGPSGSGKTTLLSLLGCLLQATQGDVLVKGIHTKQCSAKQLANLRLLNIGFVFQQFNLLAPLSAYQNVAMPLIMQNIPKKTIEEKTIHALEKLQMTSHKHKLPKQLSGGQQQRVAIARAMITNPDIVLCDEPTASLDKESAEIVLHELKEMASNGKAVAIVTHDFRLHEFADITYKVVNGYVEKV